jgi:hypothetical protein
VFGEEAFRNSPRPDERIYPMYVDRCIFIDGVHVRSAMDCPHEKPQDEMGPVVETDWTPQKARRDAILKRIDS